MAHQNVTRLSFEILVSFYLIPKNTAELLDFCLIFVRKHIHMVGVFFLFFHWAMTRPLRVMEFPRTLWDLSTGPKIRPGNSRLDFIPVSQSTKKTGSFSSSNGWRLLPRDTLRPEWHEEPRIPQELPRRGLNRSGILGDPRKSYRANYLNGTGKEII